MRQKSKQPISKIQRKIWDECKRIIRKQYGNTCYTCGKRDLEGSNWHTGHMWAKGSLPASLKYDLRILRPQCYACNINFGGMGAVFYKRMIDEEGIEFVKQLEDDKMKSKSSPIKAYDFYVELLEKYKQM